MIGKEELSRAVGHVIGDWQVSWMMTVALTNLRPSLLMTELVLAERLHSHQGYWFLQCSWILTRPTKAGKWLTDVVDE